MREAGKGREFRRGLRKRIPLAITSLLVCGILMVVLSVGSVLVFDLLRKLSVIELEPTYKIYSFRWWADELVKAGVVFGVPLLVFSAIAYWAIRRKAELRASAAVELGFCGGCGYRLNGLAQEQDGCSVCPECGAAWKIENNSQA